MGYSLWGHKRVEHDFVTFFFKVREVKISVSCRELLGMVEYRCAHRWVMVLEGWRIKLECVMGICKSFQEFFRQIFLKLKKYWILIS